MLKNNFSKIPESPEVALQAKWLNSQLENKLVIGFGMDKNSKYYKKKSIKNFNLVKLPLKVKNVFSRGKLIFFHFETNEKNHENEFKTIYMISHLGMTGNWSCEKQKHSNFWITIGIPTKYKNEKGEILYREEFKIYFTDQRHFGSINFYLEDQLEKVLKNHGPCLLIEARYKYEKNYKVYNRKYQVSCSYEHFTNMIKNKRIDDKPICEFLLEQKYISSIGNYLRCEILYHSCIHPSKKLGELKEKDIQKLYEKSLEIIYKAYITQGPENGYFLDGSFKLECYGQQTNSLGNKIEKFLDGKNRTVHYCPSIQKI